MKFLKESTDIFYIGKTEVVKNPTDIEYRQMWQEQKDRIKYYEPGEPLIRTTYDNQGNEYIWPAYDSTHYYIENEIKRKYNVKVNQAKNFNLEESYLDKEDIYPGYIINPQANKKAADEIIKAAKGYKRKIKCIRDYCGPINWDLYMYLIDNNIDKNSLHMIKGTFKTDNLKLIDKNDLTKAEKADFSNYYDIFTNDNIVEYITKVQDKLPEGLDDFYNLPHYWLAYKGLIIDDAWQMFEKALDKPVSIDNYKKSSVVESYLDKETKFYDYHTKEITKWIRPDLPNSSEIFDTSILGGYSCYDCYMKNKANIQMIAPRAYFEQAAKGFNTSIEAQIKHVELDTEALKHLHDVIFKYHRAFPMPYISKNNGSKQEGRHRVYLFAQLYGWNKSFPCLITEEW